MILFLFQSCDLILGRCSAAIAAENKIRTLASLSLSRSPSGKSQQDVVTFASCPYFGFHSECCGGPSSPRNAKKYEKKDSKPATPKALAAPKVSSAKPSGSGKRPASETTDTVSAPKKKSKSKAKK